jgi:hypothetical protein
LVDYLKSLRGPEYDQRDSKIQQASY